MIRQAFKDNIHPNKRKVQSRFPFFRLAGDCNFYIDFNMDLVIETWKNFAWKIRTAKKAQSKL